jgi:hypothetical protein
MDRDLCKTPPFAQSQRQAQILNPRNIQYIPAVKIFAFLDLDQNWTFFKGLGPLASRTHQYAESP